MDIKQAYRNQCGIHIHELYNICLLLIIIWHSYSVVLCCILIVLDVGGHLQKYLLHLNLNMW